MTTQNNRKPKPSRQNRCSLLRAIWPVILAVTLLGLPAESAVITIDPGSFPDGTNLTYAYPSVSLVAEVPAYPGTFVTNSTPPLKLTMFIMEFPTGGSDRMWTDDPLWVRIFRAEFSIETASVSVDMREGEILPPHVEPSTGVLEAYDSGGVLLETVSETLLSTSTYQTLTITRATNDIAFIRAYGTGSSHENSANISLLTYEIPPFGWIWMDGSSDFGYSQDEDDLLYFLSFGPVWYYNIDTSQWSEEGPADWVYVDWPFYYELDPGVLWFVLPPADGLGLWVFHFSTKQWELWPQTIP